MNVRRAPCLLFFLFMLSSKAAPAPQITNHYGTVTNYTRRYLVALRADAHQDSCAAEHKINRNRIWRHALNGFVANLDVTAAERLKNDPRVKTVMEDRIVAVNQSQVIPTGIRRMAVDNFPPFRIDGTDKRVDVDVAVIDSGIQANHPDLNVVQSVVFGYGELVDSGDDHGTACAGIIAALV
jgi:subtilisin